MRINYHVSSVVLDAEYVATGKRSLSSQRSLNLDETKLTEAERMLLLQAQKTLHQFLGLSFVTYAVQAPSTGGGFMPPIPPKIASKSLELDGEPSHAEIFRLIQQMLDEHQQAQADMESMQPEYERLKREHIEQQTRERLKREQEAEDRKREAEEDRKQAAIIPWREDGTAIVNLYETIFAASGLNGDSRFKNWIKDVVGIDRARSNGYAFEGEWVSNQTVEIARGKRVFLVAGTTGSRKYQTTDYRIVVMDADGVLTPTDIKTDDRDQGWALRIRDDVAELLK